jgi:hypothetical protein
VSFRTTNRTLLDGNARRRQRFRGALEAPLPLSPAAYVDRGNSIVAFVPLAAGIGGLTIGGGASELSTFAVVNLSSADVVQLRAARSAASLLPVLLYANSSGAVQLLECGDARCGGVNGLRRTFAARVDANTSLSLVTAQDTALIATWISGRSVVWQRCSRDSAQCQARVLVANASADVGIADAVAVESPVSGLAALAIVERNAKSGRTVLRLRQCALLDCTRFVGDYLGEPVPTGFRYVYTVLVGAIVGAVILCAIPVLFISRRHNIR